MNKVCVYDGAFIIQMMISVKLKEKAAASNKHENKRQFGIKLSR